MPDTPKLTQRAKFALAAAGLLVVGGAAGAGAMQATRPSVEMAPMAPVAIARAAQTSGPITLRGRVAEVYGNKFVLQDASGKTLIDLGPRGDDLRVAPGATETVQGRYDRGFMHASFLVDAAGNVTQLGPLHGPRHGPHGPPPPGGPDRGPPPPGEGPDDAAPPPPPPPPAGDAARAPAAPPAATTAQPAAH